MRHLIILLLLCVSISLKTSAQLSIGDIAPDIKLPDTSGKWLPLSTIQSKLILVDFWAVWCYPCVKSMPELIELHNKYHHKGLTIYAVSLDKGYYNWVDYCRKEKLPFILVNDAYSFNGKSCADYKVSAIPHKILLKDGKVIGSNMSTLQLENLIKKELDIDN